MRTFMLAVCVTLAIPVTAGCNGQAPSKTGPSPVVAGITPTTVVVGASITLSGSGFAPSGNAVKIGQGYLLDLQSADGRTITFALPSALGLCPPAAANQPCNQAAMALTPGTYDLAVVTSGMTSNTIRLTVQEP